MTDNMLPTQIALVPYDLDVNVADLLNVAAALQTQATRDVAPIWGVQGVISPFLELRQVPPGYFPLLLVDAIEGTHGFHVPESGRPIAAVQYRSDLPWSASASHEMIEMLIDSSGNLTTTGFTPDQGWVEYIVEPCDPCQNSFYLIGDVPVSDFVTPAYYGPAPTHGLRYSFTGSVRAPLTVTKAGALSWTTPDGRTHQKLGTAPSADISSDRSGRWRERVPHRTPDPGAVSYAAHSSGYLGAATRREYVQRLEDEVKSVLARATAADEGQSAPSEAPWVAGLSQNERILALLEEMANPAYTTYDEFYRDPEAVETRFGIDFKGVNFTKHLETQMPREHFAGVVRTARAGAALGDPNFFDYLKTHSIFYG